MCWPNDESKVDESEAHSALLVVRLLLVSISQVQVWLDSELAAHTRPAINDTQHTLRAQFKSLFSLFSSLAGLELAACEKVQKFAQREQRARVATTCSLFIIIINMRTIRADLLLARFQLAANESAAGRDDDAWLHWRRKRDQIKVKREAREESQLMAKEVAVCVVYSPKAGVGCWLVAEFSLSIALFNVSWVLNEVSSKLATFAFTIDARVVTLGCWSKLLPTNSLLGFTSSKAFVMSSNLM